jgi:type I restriction enzyme S subunit
MKKYETYKDSGIEWIGEIPGHWAKSRLAFNGEFYKGKGVSKADLSIDGLPVILYGDIYTKYNLKTEHLVRHISVEVAEKSFSIERGDLLFAASGETPDDIGKCICYLGEGVAYASGDVIVFRQKLNDSIFLSYLFNSYKVNEQKAKLSKGEIVVHIYSGQLRDIRFPLPPQKEQTAIAHYLDRKTAAIDKLIADKKRLLELYEEEKTAIINQAVTKGINPDAPMKDSGIEWLGEIPEHWEVIPITKYLESIVDYRGRTPNKQNQGLFLVTARNIKNRKIDYSLSEEFVDEEDAQNLLNRGKPMIGDVLFTTEAPLGEVANIDREDIALAQRIIKFRGRTDVLDNYYLMFFMSSDCFRQDLYSYSTGSTAIGIKASKLHHLRCLLPPIFEQISIVHHIETECARIDAKKSKTQKLIELLSEYRTALISEVVTGKIKVVP